MQGEENGAHLVWYLIKCSERNGSFETRLHVVQSLVVTECLCLYRAFLSQAQKL